MITLGICHADFHEYLESQPNLLKVICSCDNLYSWAQQPNPQSASNGEAFHDSQIIRDSEIVGEDDDRGLGLETPAGFTDRG